MAGIAIYALFAHLDFLLISGDRPGLQSFFMTLGSSINVLLNFILILRFGLLEAATVTAVSFTFSGLLLIHGMVGFFHHPRT